MPNLMLVRKQFRCDGIFGELQDEAGKHVCYTLEHAYGDDTNGYLPKIPQGTFSCVRGEHRLEGMMEDFTTFEIRGIEGHTGLLFHWGNFDKESTGCVLLGRTIAKVPGGQMITNSRQTFSEFMLMQRYAQDFELIVVNRVSSN